MTFPIHPRTQRASANKFSPLASMRHLRVVIPAAFLVTFAVPGIAAPTFPNSAPDQQTPRVAINTTEEPRPQLQLGSEQKPFPTFEDFKHEQHNDVASFDVTSAATVPATTLSFPYGIALDPSGNIYVTNLFSGVNIYNENNYSLKTKFSNGMSFPAAVSVGWDGTIYVANNGGDNITVYNPGLTQTGTITDSTLLSPTSMFVDNDGDIWVLDAQGTTHLYLNNGTAIGSSQTGGTAIGPWGFNVTVWGITNPSGGYIEDLGNMGEGVHGGPLFPSYFPAGSPYAGGEAQDSLGQQYVTDVLNNRVEIWNSSSQYQVGIVSLPSPGYGVAVDSTHGRFYVVETQLNQVQVFSTKAPYGLITTIK